jgi:PAS domain S-box-containing protein
MHKDGGMTEEDALRLVVEGTVSETGVEFFRSLVKNLATVTGAAGVWVTEYLAEEKRLRAYAFWLNGSFVENFEYDIVGTACATVVESKRLVHIPERLIELYPQDPDLVPLKAVSYLGAPLLSTDGSVMGHLSILDDKSLPAVPRLFSLFDIFAARAAAEVRRLRIEQEVRTREEELSALLGGAMDGIVVLDGQMTIIRANPAAERLFGCTEEDLIGESLRAFLDQESASHLDAFTKDLNTRPHTKGQLWIPHSFTVKRWDKSLFPAEATLSRFSNRGQTYHTVILRNVDERLEADRRIQSLTSQTEYLQEELQALRHFGEIIGQSPALRQVLREVEQVAATDTTVLIQGETGTGKELFARAIHAASKRRGEPLVTVNCAAIPANLIESEFFGHERGAFTGATTKREGRFALADGGTIFLDEVGELPLELQSKLLRVLQEGTFEPVGGSVTRKVKVRVVAATNRDLAREVSEGRFREDLFYRLNVFPLRLPPLRERKQDIPALATAFARRFAQQIGRSIHPLSPENLSRLRAYSWPGNVRELQNVVERAVITTANGQLNLDRALPRSGESSSLSSGSAPVNSAGTPSSRLDSDGAPARIHTLQELENLERANLIRALEAAQWRISGDSGAAALLAMNPSTLRSRMKALGLKAAA